MPQYLPHIRKVFKLIKDHKEELRKEIVRQKCQQSKKTSRNKIRKS